MKLFIITVWTLVWFFIGAVAHEIDLSRNFKKTGNAKAWYFEINKGE